MLTVVIGAGAAGIAAARHLHDQGREVLLVEANDRIGGRAHSVKVRLSGSEPPIPLPPALSAALAPSVAPAKAGAFQLGNDPPSPEQTPASARVTSDGSGVTIDSGTTASICGITSATIDLGCGWLHSARRNPWTAIAERTGFTVDRSSPKWDEQWRDLGFPPEDQRAAGEAWDRWETAAHAALAGPDRPLSDFIAADDPWRAMIDAISQYANGAPLDRISLHDWAAYEDAATDDNWAVREGYGTLIAAHAAGVPVRLSTPVSRIDHRGRRIRVETPGGTIEADRVIVCVPTTQLVYAIAFDPPLPAKVEAAAALPLGLADKLFLAVDRLEWPADTHLIGDPRRSCTGSYRLSPFGLPIIETFLGGDCVEALEEDGAAAAFAIDELVALLGSDWRRRLHPLAATRWRQAPFIHGSYSHARVGHASARRCLAEPVDDRLFFAGEACSTADFSTAHGAYQTGIAAAEAIVGERA